MARQRLNLARAAATNGEAATRHQGDAGVRENELMTPSRQSRFRRLAALIAAAGTLFWLYTFYAIAHVPLGDGSGFQWLAVFPLGTVFLAFFLPAWVLVAIGRLPTFATVWGVGGLIAFVVIWMQLLAEFPKS